MAQIGIGEEWFALEPGGRFQVGEHTQVHLRGLQLGSEVRVTANGGEARRCPADASGGVKGLLEACDLMSLSTMTLEVEVTAGGEPLMFWLTTEPIFNPEQTARMIADLGNAELYTSLDNQIATQLGALAPQVDGFIALWGKLVSAVRELLRRPSEGLLQVQALAPLHARLKLTHGDLARNLREGRVLAGGVTPLGETGLWATREQSSHDTPENAYVAQVVRHFQRARADLDRALRGERERLERQRASEQGFELAVGGYEPVLERLQGFVRRLQALDQVPLPASWRRFHSPPHRQTNRTRFDPPYRRVAVVEDALGRLLGDSTLREQRHRSLDELGRRRTWQLYEYWVTAQLYRCLRNLRFEPEGREGFGQLEDVRGGVYGLRPEASVTLCHAKEPRLRLRLTYQPRLLDAQGRELRPDIGLEFLGLERLNSGFPTCPRALFIDAKCSRLAASGGHTEDLLERSARRYRHAHTHGDAAAFLVGMGATLWPDGVGAEPPLRKEDRDFRVGAVRLEPLVPDGDYGLRRVITAWLLASRVVAVCTQCGQALNATTAGPVEAGGKPLPADFSAPATSGHAFRCKSCGTGVTVNHCRNCWHTVYKIYPRGRGRRQYGDEPNEVFSRTVEIQRPSCRSGAMRHCARCGSDGV